MGDLSTTRSEEHSANPLVPTDQDKTSFPCNLCIMPRPIGAVQHTTCSGFVLTFIDDEKCTPNSCAVRSRLACRSVGLYTACYCCGGEVHGDWVSDSLSLHLTKGESSSERPCSQALWRCPHPSILLVKLVINQHSFFALLKPKFGFKGHYLFYLCILGERGDSR